MGGAGPGPGPVGRDRGNGTAGDGDEGVRALLEVEELEAGYGPLQVLFGASVAVRPGELVALLGTNGAGKSTLLRAVSGLMRPTGGRVLFKGQDVTGARPRRLVEMGMIYIAGGRAVFPSLTVLENLKMSAYQVRRQRDEVTARIDEACALFPRLRERISQRAGTLSGGEQQMVAIGRALVSRPDLLMIDELSLGLAPVMLEVIQQMLTTLAEKGITMLIVEQSLNMAAKIARRAYFLEKGQVRFEGDINELITQGDLARAVFFGAHAADDHGNGNGNANGNGNGNGNGRRRAAPNGSPSRRPSNRSKATSARTSEP